MTQNETPVCKNHIQTKDDTKLDNRVQEPYTNIHIMTQNGNPEY